MASSKTKQSSRFSTFKIFKFSSSKPPPPPPKDAHYLYASSSRNPSVVSFSNQSVLPSDSDPQSSTCRSNGCAAVSVRTPSPAPSRMLHPTSRSQSQLERFQPQQSPPSSILTSAQTPDPPSLSSKKSIFRKVSTFRKRSTSKSSPVASLDDATDDESISPPWNFQVSVSFTLCFAWPSHVFSFPSLS